MSEKNSTSAFDTVVTLEDKTNVHVIDMAMSKESFLEEKREEMLYFRERANDFNKKACWVGVVGVTIFVFLSLSGVLSFEVTTLMKFMSMFVGIAMGLLLLISLFFTFLFTYGLFQINKAIGVAVSGFLLFCILPFLSIFILAAIPLWNRFITKKLDKIFIEQGLEPILINEDPI